MDCHFKHSGGRRITACDREVHGANASHGARASDGGHAVHGAHTVHSGSAEGAGNRPCEYGVACRRQGCSFAHPPQPGVSYMNESSTTSWTKGTASLATPACRFGSLCTKPACTYAHTSTEVAAARSNTTLHVPVPCKYGAGCQYGDSCMFSHALASSSWQAAASQGANTFQSKGTPGSIPAYRDKINQSSEHGENETLDEDGEYQHEEDEHLSEEGEYQHEEDEYLGSWQGAHHDEERVDEEGAEDEWWSYCNANTNAAAWTGDSTSGPQDWSRVSDGLVWQAEQYAGQAFGTGNEMEAAQLRLQGSTGDEATDAGAGQGAGAGVEQLVSVPHVGVAVVEWLRLRYGIELQAILVAPPGLPPVKVVWDEGANTLYAVVPHQAACDAEEHLTVTVLAARASLAEERREVPVVGGTRLLLSPGGTIEAVLTAAEFVSVSVTGLAAGTKVQEVEEKLAAPVAASSELYPWKLKGSRTAPKDHTFTKSGQRLRVVWECGIPTGVAFVKMGSREEARRLVGPASLKGAVRLGSAGMVFVGSSPKNDRVVKIKQCRTQDRYGVRDHSVKPLSEAMLRTEIQQRLPSSTVEQVSVLLASAKQSKGRGKGKGKGSGHRPGAVGTGMISSEAIQATNKDASLAKLRPLFQKHGELSDITCLPFNHKRCSGCAFVRYSQPESYHLALAALHNTVSFGSGKLHLQIDCSLALHLDARVLRAVRPRLTQAVETARTTFPSVSVKISERAVATEVVAPVPHRFPAPMAAAATEALIKISGNQMDQLAQTRAMIEGAVAGRLFEGHSPADVAKLLTPAGKVFLLGLEAEHEVPKSGGTAAFVHIRWERQLNRLRLYGPDQQLDVLERAINQHLEDETGLKLRRTVALPMAVYHNVVASGRAVMDQLQRESGDLAAAHILGEEAEGESEECPVCMSEVEEPYCLAACGDSYCRGCLEAMLQSATRNNAFPVMCCSMGCGANVCLTDLERLLSASVLADAYKAAFCAFMQQQTETWGRCLSADCEQSCSEHQAWLKASKQGDSEFEAFASSKNTYDHLVQKHGGIFPRDGIYN
eukprot:gene12496-15710_t